MVRAWYYGPTVEDDYSEDSGLEGISYGPGRAAEDFRDALDRKMEMERKYKDLADEFIRSLPELRSQMYQPKTLRELWIYWLGERAERASE
jgi:hypothetical protein